MKAINFDNSHFRRVIARSSLTKFTPSLDQLLQEAAKKFYDEFDYYPNLAACAPGTFTILGEYMELAKGLIIQAALPHVTLVVARCHNCQKCRIATCSEDIEEPKKVVFPIIRCRILKKGFPYWANLLKGIMNIFLRKNVRGFDAVIHSSIPISQGYGSSAGLMAAFYTLVGLMTNNKCEEDQIKKAKKCKIAEKNFGKKKIGLFNHITAFLAESRNVVAIDTDDFENVEIFSFRDPNILFLLTVPIKPLLDNQDNLVRIRETELKLAARLLNLPHIKYAEAHHLEALASMEDPTREKVIELLREFENDEEYIRDFADEFFTLPVLENALSSLEDDYFNGEQSVAASDSSSKKFPNGSKGAESDDVLRGESELFYKFQYKTICNETICLGGLSDLSVRSDLTAMSKLLRRVRYVITENMRARSLIYYVTKLDFVSAGVELTRSHLSLKTDFEMSCPTLDKMVQFTAELGEGVFGSKMTRSGGTITLLHRNWAHNTIESIKAEFGEELEFYLVFPNWGAREVKLYSPFTPKSLLSDEYPRVEELMKRAVQNFEVTYQRMPTHGCYAPGVFNVLGGHTDYNRSFSLPVAVGLVTVVVGALNGSGKIRVATAEKLFGEKQKLIFALPSISPPTPGKHKWVNYVKGVISNFKGKVPGFDCFIESSISKESRVSSSTALLVSMYTFLEELTGIRTMDKAEKSFLCMKSEHEFTNTLCSISNFLVSITGIENKIAVVDTKKCSLTYFPFFDPSLIFLLINTSSKTSNKALLYTRLEQCNDVAKALGLKYLRCVREENLNNVKNMSETVLKRARHVVSEEKRIIEGIEALRKFDPVKFGHLMLESHISLRDQFEISHPNLDNIVERSMEINGVLGARMADSMFGGSVLCLVKKWAVDDVIECIRDLCDERLKFYIVTPSAGAKPLDIKGYVESMPAAEYNFNKIFEF